MALPRVVGRYALQHEIASGGMATVYLGRLCGPARFSPVVAIKSLHPHFAKEPEFVRMFLDEARLAARIRHANIVPVIDVHEQDELFLVLEYIHGESLSRLLSSSARDGKLVPLPIVSAVVGDVLRGLHAAHDARDEAGLPLGVVHRDVSPHNILVGVDGVARVFDFGVAKAAGRLTMTREGQVKGKFAYMAPEQLRGEDVNRQADVYSASVVLWEALTGKRLFRADAEGTVVHRVLYDPVPAPSERREGVPSALDAVVMRGLARERSNRYASANEMALELQRIVPPASPQAVGEWVEGCACDALADRSRAIATLNELPLETGVSVLTPVPPERSRSLLVGAVAAVIVGVGATGAWIATRGHATEPAPAIPVAVDSIAAPSPPASAPAPEESASSAPAASSDEAVASSRPASSHARAQGVAKHGPAPAAGATATCARRGPDGIIQFDTQCLREAQGGR